MLLDYISPNSSLTHFTQNVFFLVVPLKKCSVAANKWGHVALYCSGCSYRWARDVREIKFKYDFIIHIFVSNAARRLSSLFGRESGNYSHYKLVEMYTVSLGLCLCRWQHVWFFKYETAILIIWCCVYKCPVWIIRFVF